MPALQPWSGGPAGLQCGPQRDCIRFGYNSLPKNLLFQDFEMEAFWKHALAVAVTSKNLAQKAGRESPDNCFVGGLLHDVEKVILAQYFQELFVKVWTRMQTESLSFHEAEQHELPVDHAMIGAYLAERWALPQGLIDSIRWHQDFQSEIPNANFVMIIYLANILVNSYDENSDCTIDMAALHPAGVKFLMTQLENSADWYSRLTGEIEASYSFFLEPEF
jgi:putative nucleotidyltransferase with HDIG domain